MRPARPPLRWILDRNYPPAHRHRCGMAELFPLLRGTIPKKSPSARRSNGGATRALSVPQHGTRFGTSSRIRNYCRWGARHTTEGCSGARPQTRAVTVHSRSGARLTRSQRYTRTSDLAGAIPLGIAVSTASSNQRASVHQHRERGGTSWFVRQRASRMAAHAYTFWGQRITFAQGKTARLIDGGCIARWPDPCQDRRSLRVTGKPRQNRDALGIGVRQGCLAPPGVRQRSEMYPADTGVSMRGMTNRACPAQLATSRCSQVSKHPRDKQDRGARAVVDPDPTAPMA